MVTGTENRSGHCNGEDLGEEGVVNDLFVTILSVGLGELCLMVEGIVRSSGTVLHIVSVCLWP